MVPDLIRESVEVHGDIRHLEIVFTFSFGFCFVHGDIRHLEKAGKGLLILLNVHGDIRHLETRKTGF